MREWQGEEYQVVREEQGLEWQEDREQQGREYQDLREAQGREYGDVTMEEYQDAYEDWTERRETAMNTAEGQIDRIVKDYGGAFKGTVGGRWVPMMIINVVVFVIILVLQKRKDKV
jgi:hypothetical protein